MGIIARNEKETTSIAEGLVKEIRPGVLIALRGDLGAGKTVFARALIRALTGQKALEVPSPTFSLVQTYETSLGQLWHLDLYRLERPEDVYELGWEDARHEIMLIEWPERLGNLLPPVRIDIQLSILENDPDQRIIRIRGAK